jgi:nitroreductase
MQFSELVKMRESVRDYLDKPVERYKITRCLESARLAPSACNNQPWEFIVVDDPQLKDAVAQNTFGVQASVPINHWTMQVPVLILVLTDQPTFQTRIKGMVSCKVYEFLTDIGMTVSYFCLRAVEEGLGTCVLGNFNEKRVKKLLKLPASKKIVLLISLGYPKSNEPRLKVRKRMDQMVKYNMEGSGNQNALD